MAEHEIELVAIVSKLYIGMIIELHMTASAVSNDWWYDTSVTIHVCNNKNYFKYYEVEKMNKKL